MLCKHIWSAAAWRRFGLSAHEVTRCITKLPQGRVTFCRETGPKRCRASALQKSFSKEVQMDLKLQDKTAVVSGSTAGIGFAIASVLAQEGAAVVLNGRTSERVSRAVEKIKKASPGARVSGVAADLSTREGAEKLFEQVPETDILINNLGMFEAKPFAQIPDSEWLHIFEVNVLSGVRLSRRYLPAMMTKDWGRIIFISSESGVNIPAEMIHYGVTKTAQLALARGLAETTVGSNVTVNSVLPGPTSSEGVDKFLEDLARSRGT